MPLWNRSYYDSLVEQFQQITDGLDDRLDKVVAGRTTPKPESIRIGSARKVSAATCFFDIDNFSSRTGSANPDTLKSALLLLDCVIPSIMQVMYDHGGYVEKNTGDGIMAIIGADSDDQKTADDALDAAAASLFVVDELVNPYLQTHGVDKVSAKLGIDLGNLLIARIGRPTGSAPHPRNFLTAVGPAANIAHSLQDYAPPNSILVGDFVKRGASGWHDGYFRNVTPSWWNWVYSNAPSVTYNVWEYTRRRIKPHTGSVLSELLDSL